LGPPRLSFVIGLRVVVFAVGLAVVIWALGSAITTVVLPRGSRSIISRVVFGAVGGVLDLIARKVGTYERGDRVLALWSPVALILVVGLWLVMVLGGCTLMFWAMEPDLGFAGAYGLSGSSLTTLGFVSADTVSERTLAFTEATLGLLLLTMLITYLPTLYSVFSRRETSVALLEARAGSPPDAVEFLIRYDQIGRLSRIEDEWAEWEVWFNFVQESHISYPPLVFFRSPDPHRSWITAAGTVLDAAALWVSLFRDVGPASAGITIRSGYLALRELAEFFGIEYDHDPAPTDPISITRPEFDAAYARLADAGADLVPDIDEAWANFAGWRVNYDTVLLDLAELLHAPYAPWTSDRSAVGYVAGGRFSRKS
jgi:hypothetical protein